MLSVSHLIIIFLVALIVFGPEKLPELARTLSKAMFEFNRATGGLKQTLQDEMHQLEREISEQGAAKPPATPAPHAAPTEPVASSGATWPPEPVLDHAPETAESLSGAASDSPSTLAAGEDGPAPDHPGNPSDGHPTAA